MTDETVPPKSAPHSGQWKKGQSGNPKGRPPGRSYRNALDRNAARLSTEFGFDVEDKIAEQHLRLALSGNPWAIKEYADRTEGKPINPIAGADGGPVKIEAIVTGVIREGDE